MSSFGQGQAGLSRSELCICCAHCTYCTHSTHCTQCTHCTHCIHCIHCTHCTLGWQLEYPKSPSPPVQALHARLCQPHAYSIKVPTGT